MLLINTLHHLGRHQEQKEAEDLIATVAEYRQENEELKLKVADQRGTINGLCEEVERLRNLLGEAYLNASS